MIEPIKIRLIDNGGGGFVDEVEVERGTTALSFLQARIGDPSNSLVRINGSEVRSDYVLEQDDKVSITPLKVAGA